MRGSSALRNIGNDQEFRLKAMKASFALGIISFAKLNLPIDFLLQVLQQEIFLKLPDFGLIMKVLRGHERQQEMSRVPGRTLAADKSRRIQSEWINEKLGSGPETRRSPLAVR